MSRLDKLHGFDEVSGLLQCGVYALASKGTVIYVGKSKSLYQRIYAHRTRAKRTAKGHKLPDWVTARAFVFDQVFIRPCHPDQMDALEVEMIERYKPRFNVSLKTTARPRLDLAQLFPSLIPAQEPLPRRVLA